MTEFYFQILCFLFFPTCPVKVSTSPPQEQIEYLWFQMFRCMSLIVCCLCLSGQLQQIQSHPQPQQLSRCSAVVRIMSLLSGIGVQSCPPLPLSYPGDVCYVIYQPLFLLSCFGSMLIACNVLFPEEIKKFCIHAVYAVMEKCSDADDRDPVKCLQEMDKVFKAMKLKI